jgi:hypothetical protein
VQGEQNCRWGFAHFEHLGHLPRHLEVAVMNLASHLGCFGLPFLQYPTIVDFAVRYNQNGSALTTTPYVTDKVNPFQGVSWPIVDGRLCDFGHVLARNNPSVLRALPQQRGD